MPFTEMILLYFTGAAVSALVYIQLIKKQQELKLPYDICNVTFACPLFGNKALKTHVDENKQFENMFHFIKEGDIVPGNISTWFKMIYITMLTYSLMHWNSRSDNQIKHFAPS